MPEDPNLLKDMVSHRHNTMFEISRLREDLDNVERDIKKHLIEHKMHGLLSVNWRGLHRVLHPRHEEHSI